MVNSIVEVPDELKGLIDVSAEKDKGLKKLANKTKAVMLAFVASYVPLKVSPSEAEFATVGISEEFGIETVLTQINEQLEEQNLPLLMLLNSQGGAMASSYKTAKALRDNFKNITVYIPHVALSGGTLVALTGNKIIMGQMSHLSPLDVQLEYKGMIISANDILRCKGRLDDYFKDKDVNSVPYSMKAFADKMDGAIFEHVFSLQTTAYDYVREILKKSGYKKPDELARKFVFKLPSHGYVIDYEKARKLKLKVEYYTKHLETWQHMRFWLAKYIAKATDKHFIRYVIPEI